MSVNSDLHSDSGFLEDETQHESNLGKFVTDKPQCTIDDIAYLLRNSRLECRSDQTSDSVESTVSCSSNQSEDRRSTLKQASNYKKKRTNIKTNIKSRSAKSAFRRKTESSQQNKTVKDVSRCKSAPSKAMVSIQTPDSDEKLSCDSYQKRMKMISRLSSMYDSRLERSKTFLHGQSKVFSKASQYLAPARPGLRNLQVCYSKTNMENNKGKIFGDLVKTAHKQNIVICETVNSIERRLFRKRTDPTKKTTYYNNMKMPDPFRVKPKKAQTVAEKKKERKDRITETTEEIKLGFKRTSKTVKSLSREDVEKLKQCRYLRLDQTLLERIPSGDKKLGSENKTQEPD